MFTNLSNKTFRLKNIDIAFPTLKIDSLNSITTWIVPKNIAGVSLSFYEE